VQAEVATAVAINVQIVATKPKNAPLFFMGLSSLSFNYL
jgi:hypothetical protein